MTVRLPLVIAMSLALLTAALPVRAETPGATAACDAARRPWVLLAFGERPPPATIAGTLLRDVRAGLAEADVCDGGSARQGAPAATLEIGARGGSQRYAIEVRDEVTQKRVGREIDLATVPEDGRSVALGIAAAELLRAAWAELLLHARTEAPRAAPDPAAAALAARMREARTPDAPRPARPSNHLGARGAFEVFSTGLALAGGDVFYRRTLDRFSIGVAFAARGGLPVTAPHGTIQANAIGGEVEAGFTVVRAGRFDLAIEAGVGVARVLFRGTPVKGAEGDRFDGVAVVPRGGIAAGLDVAGVVRFDARVAGGGVAAAVVPLDDATRAPGVRGGAFLGTLGVGALF
ncbi:MAG: hypothetical protein QM820_21060 [Minicystis sp.]